jgi:NADP-dependent 3-hydroxy acid dehydrogenase YdfG
VTRTHLVTGAGSGIGSAVAGRLRDRGDHLVLPVRSAERVEELRPAFPQADFVIADLADHGLLPEFASVVPERLDSVVHAAGQVSLGTVEELDAEGWHRQLDVNLVAPALLTAAVLPALRAAGGTVVMVNSGSGLRSKPGWSAYAASKFGLRALADALREEEAGSGVRVSTIYPGRTATEMQAQVHEHEGKDYDPQDWVQPETVADAVLHVLDLGPDATVPDLSVMPR